MKKVFIVLVYIAIFILGFFIAYEGLKLSRIFVKNPITSAVPTPNAFALATAKPASEVQPVKQDAGTYNVLLLGYGGPGHDGSNLTDSMIVVHVNTNTHKVTFVSIPRDLWVNGNQKINATGISAFTNAEPVVTAVTGLPINYFVATYFGQFTKIIDDLGGITANTPVAFSDPFYPILGQENNTCGFTEDQISTLKAKYSGYNLETQFTCRYVQLNYKAGPVSLDGTTALQYVRSRHGDSDFGRSARQFAVLEGVAAKLISFQAAGKFDDIVNTISSSVKTDLDAGTIKSLVGIIGDPKAYIFNTVQLTTDNVLNQGTSSDGQFILYPKTGMFDYSGTQAYVKANLQ